MATVDSTSVSEAGPEGQASEPSSLPTATAPRTEADREWSDDAWRGWSPTWWTPGWGSWQWQRGNWDWSGRQGPAQSPRATGAGMDGAGGNGATASSDGAATQTVGEFVGATVAAPGNPADPWAAAAAAITAAAAQVTGPGNDPGQVRPVPSGRDAPPRADSAQERPGGDGGWGGSWGDSWRWSSSNVKGDYSDPPTFPGWAHRRYWTSAIRRWNKNTDVPLFRRGEKVLRSLGWELQADMEHLSEDELSASDYLEKILAVIDAKAGVREDDEKRKSFKAVMTENQRKREESLSQYSLRRQRDFQKATAFGFNLPSELRAAMLKEGASLSEQNLQNLVAILGPNDSDPDRVAKALCQLDIRSDRLVGFATEEADAGETRSSYVSEELGDEGDEELDDEEVLAELEALDLYEDQVCEVFAVLDGNGAFKKRRTWKENRLMKAEMRKDRGSIVKGSDAPPRGHGGGLPGGRDYHRGRDGRGAPRGRGAMSREQLKKVSRCRGCGQKGHWVAECPNKGASSGFVYVPEAQGSSSVAFSFLTRRELFEAIQEAREERVASEASVSAWSYLTMPSGDAIVDTGATQDLIGAAAYKALVHRLADVGLRPIPVDVPCAVPSGIGGKASVDKVVLVPISPGGCAGVLQMVVLTADIPPLLSIGFMDYMGTIIDLPAKMIRFSSHNMTVPLTELPSGHRSIPLVDWAGGTFVVPMQLQKKFGLPEDAFHLPVGPSSVYTKEKARRQPVEFPGANRSLQTIQPKSFHVNACAVHQCIPETLKPNEPDPEELIPRDLRIIGSSRMPMSNSASLSALPSHDHGTGDSFDFPVEMLASGGVSTPDHPRVEPPDVLQVGDGRALKEEPPGAVEVCDGGRERGGHLPAPGESHHPPGQPVGIVAGVHAMPGKDCLRLQAAGEGQGQSQGDHSAQSGDGGTGDRGDSTYFESVRLSSFPASAQTRDDPGPELGDVPRPPEHDASLLDGDPAAECGHEPGHGSDQLVSTRAGEGPKPDAGNERGQLLEQRQAHTSATGRALSSHGHGCGPARDKPGRMGRGQPQCRGLRKPRTSWPLWATTSLLSLTSALAWDQCSSELRGKFSRGKFSDPGQCSSELRGKFSDPGQCSSELRGKFSDPASPRWVVHTDVEAVVGNLPMDALPVQLEGHAHPRLPCGLRAVTYAINGLEIPLGWSGVAQEVRDSHGQLRYRGVEAWQGSQELEGGESARSWVLPSRLAAAWCTLGGRGEVLGLDDQGNPCRSGPFWVLYGTNGSELWAEGSSEIAPEEGLSGDLHACRKSLLSLFGNSGTERDPPSRADYLEVFGSTPLGDHLRHRGLRVPVSEALEDCWSVSGRTSIRNHVRHHRPRILAARWSSSSSFLSVPEGASSLVRGRLVHGFALELVREQVQRGDHFVIDYEADNLCAEGEAVEDLAMFVQSYQEQGKPRLLASSFPVRLSVEESRQAGSLEDVTGPLRDRVAEERCAKELLEEMNFSFEACQDLINKTSLPVGPQSRRSLRNTDSGPLCTVQPRRSLGYDPPDQAEASLRELHQPLPGLARGRGPQDQLLREYRSRSGRPH